MRSKIFVSLQRVYAKSIGLWQGDKVYDKTDQWLYFLKNLQNFSDMPSIFKDDVLEQAFEKAELANIGPAERDKYEASLKVYRDLKNVIDTAFDDGIEKGIEKGNRERDRERNRNGHEAGNRKRYPTRRA